MVLSPGAVNIEIFVPFQFPEFLESYFSHRPVHEKAVRDSFAVPINTEIFHLLL